MDHITVQYVGEQDHLIGQAAMVLGETEEYFDVQFNSLHLVTMMSFPMFHLVIADDGYWYFGTAEIRFPIQLAYGSHRFKKDQFLVIERQTAEDTARLRADAERLRPGL